MVWLVALVYCIIIVVSLCNCKANNNQGYSTLPHCLKINQKVSFLDNHVKIASKINIIRIFKRSKCLHSFLRTLLLQRWFERYAKRSKESKKKLIASNPFFIFAGCKVAAIVALKQHAEWRRGGPFSRNNGSPSSLSHFVKLWEILMWSESYIYALPALTI